MNLETVHFVRQYFCVFYTLAGAAFILWIALKIFMDKSWLQATLLFICMVTCAGATILACWTGGKTYILHHDYRIVLFGEKIPATQEEQSVLRPKIMKNLEESRTMTTDQIAVYMQEKRRLATMKQGTVEEKTAYLTMEDTVLCSLEIALDYKSVYERRRAAAYYAGFEREVRAIPDISFN